MADTRSELSVSSYVANASSTFSDAGASDRESEREREGREGGSYHYNRGHFRKNKIPLTVGGMLPVLVGEEVEEEEVEVQEEVEAVAEPV
jgi:hypothetical protein